MIVISNTSPLHYLIRIDAEGILPNLYGRVIIPIQVLDELQNKNAPIKIQQWIKSRPVWLEVTVISGFDVPTRIHTGEAAAIALAQNLEAHLLLIDDQEARSYAEQLGLRVTGLLGVLRDAADQNLLNLEDSFERLRKETNFRAAPKLFDEVLRNFRERKLNKRIGFDNDPGSPRPR